MTTIPVHDRLATAQQVLREAEVHAGLRQRLAGSNGLVLQSESNSGAVSPELVLPVPSGMAALFPDGGLRRGSAVHVRGSTSVLLILAAAACGEGDTWCAVLSMPDVGLVAAAEAGLDLRRTVVVPQPGPDAPAVLGALIDGFDVVLVGDCPALSAADYRAATTRLRTREAVLLSSAPWIGAHTVLQVSQHSWAGLGAGSGVLTGAQAMVTASVHGVMHQRRINVGDGEDASVSPPDTPDPRDWAQSSADVVRRTATNLIPPPLMHSRLPTTMNTGLVGA
ncbi:MAG: hypothetical protein ACK5KU_11475 [Beutenbergiaceae bacterium]